MIIPTKQMIITVTAILSIGIASFSGYYALGIAYGQESNSHIPPIDIPDLPDFPELPDFPDPSEPPCISPCPPDAEVCVDMCL